MNKINYRLTAQAPLRTAADKLAWNHYLSKVYRPFIQGYSFYQSLLAQLDKQISKHRPNPLAVCDLGCGPLVTVEHLAENHPSINRIAAYDYDADAPELGRRENPSAYTGKKLSLYPNTDLTQPIDFEAHAPYDVVLCINMLYLFDESGQRQTLSSIKNNLKPDGIALIGSIMPPFTKYSVDAKHGGDGSIEKQEIACIVSKLLLAATQLLCGHPLLALNTFLSILKFVMAIKPMKQFTEKIATGQAMKTTHASMLGLLESEGFQVLDASAYYTPEIHGHNGLDQAGAVLYTVKLKRA